jgi:hypothetical protein
LVKPTVWRRASVVVIDDEPTSKRRDATCASSPEKSVPTKSTRRPSLSAMARRTSLSKPVNWPAESMQMLGGASDRVPTVNTPGVCRPRPLTSTESIGSTPSVVYLSAPGPCAAAARLVGSALALSIPGGAHWSARAAGAMPKPRPNTIARTRSRTADFEIPSRVILET